MIEMALEWNNPLTNICWRWIIEMLQKGVKSLQEMSSSVSVYNFEQVCVYWDIVLNTN